MFTVPPFDVQLTLVGEKTLLRPLQQNDLEPLFAVASDPEIWAMHPYFDRYKREIFVPFFEEGLASKGASAIIDQSSGDLIGSTRFDNYDASASEIEIGWTFFARSHWRTGHNREVKAMMLKHIFQHVKSVVFHIGSSNFRSRTAVERLGALFSHEYVREHYGVHRPFVVYRLIEADQMQAPA